MTAVVQSDVIILRRAHRLANVASRAVGLQVRRLHSVEPEDAEFPLRWWADLQLLLTSLVRLRAAARLAQTTHRSAGVITNALADFDRQLPHLRSMRNVVEHIDDYAGDRGRDTTVRPSMLEVGAWDGHRFTWIGRSIDIGTAEDAGRALYRQIRNALSAVEADAARQWTAQSTTLRVGQVLSGTVGPMGPPGGWIDLGLYLPGWIAADELPVDSAQWPAEGQPIAVVVKAIDESLGRIDVVLEPSDSNTA